MEKEREPDDVKYSDLALTVFLLPLLSKCWD